MKTLILCRGIAGSGKSTVTNRIVTDMGLNRSSHVFSTDDFFFIGCPDDSTDKERFEYYRKGWSKERQIEAHKWNFDRFKSAVLCQATPVIVDNTNVQLWEMEKYAGFACVRGYRLEVKYPDSPWWHEYKHCLGKDGNPEKQQKFAQILYEKNVHGVPIDHILGMIQRWEW